MPGSNSAELQVSHSNLDIFVCYVKCGSLTYLALYPGHLVNWTGTILEVCLPGIEGNKEEVSVAYKHKDKDIINQTGYSNPH